MFCCLLNVFVYLLVLKFAGGVAVSKVIRTTSIIGRAIIGDHAFIATWICLVSIDLVGDIRRWEVMLT